MTNDDLAIGRATSPENPKADHSAARMHQPRSDVVRPAYLAHAVLNARDVQSMSAWYANVLGAKSTFAARDVQIVTPTGSPATMDLDFLTFDKEHHRIAFVRVGETALESSGSSNLHHLAFTYANISDLISTFKRLASDGIVPALTIHHGPTVSNYYVDPEGNQVELQVDAFDTREALDAWFRSGAFALNPMGTPFDFAALVERFETGATMHYLVATDGFIEELAR